jgi:hypothetical protein
MLDESALRDQVLEFLHGYIVVVDVALLAGAWAASSVRDGGHEDVGVPLLQELVERAFAHARGAGDDDGAAVFGEGGS